MCFSSTASRALRTPFSRGSSNSIPSRPGKPTDPAACNSSRVNSTGATLHLPSMTGEKLIVENRRARHEYHLGDRFEAGLVLQGTEVKSLRGGQATLQQ